MTSIEDLTNTLSARALDKLYLGQRVGFRWKNGAWHTGTVMILHAKSRQAYILEDDGVSGWHQPIEELQLLPEATPPPIDEMGAVEAAPAGAPAQEQRVTLDALSDASPKKGRRRRVK